MCKRVDLQACRRMSSSYLTLPAPMEELTTCNEIRRKEVYAEVCEMGFLNAAEFKHSSQICE